MILERRTNQGMLRLIQPKDGGCEEKPSEKCEKEGEKRSAAASDGLEGNHEGKPQPKKTDETNHVPSHVGITKSGLVNAAPSAADKTSPLTSPGKLTYNPITHAPSMGI